MSKAFVGIQVVVKAFPVGAVRKRLHEIIARSPAEQSLVAKRAFWQRLAAVLNEEVPAFEYGFWDLVRGSGAEEEFESWSSAIEGAVATEAEEVGSAPDEINRISADKRYVIVTAIFLLQERRHPTLTPSTTSAMPPTK